MKKNIAVLTAMLLLTAGMLCGCGNKTNTDTDKSPATTAPVESTDVTDGTVTDKDGILDDTIDTGENILDDVEEGADRVGDSVEEGIDKATDSMDGDAKTTDNASAGAAKDKSKQ